MSDHAFSVRQTEKLSDILHSVYQLFISLLYYCANLKLRSDSVFCLH